MQNEIQRHFEGIGFNKGFDYLCPWGTQTKEK